MHYRLKETLGPERAKLLSISSICDEKLGDVTVVGLTEENARKMDAIGRGEEGAFSVRMSDIIGGTEILEYRIAESYQRKDGSTESVAAYGGAVTVDKTNSVTGNVQIFVHPRAISIVEPRMASLVGRSKSDDGGALYFTNEIVDAHEYGHAHEGMSGGHVDSTAGRAKALEMENYMRGRQKGTVGPRRRTKH